MSRISSVQIAVIINAVQLVVVSWEYLLLCTIVCYLSRMIHNEQLALRFVQLSWLFVVGVRWSLWCAIVVKLFPFRRIVKFANIRLACSIDSSRNGAHSFPHLKIIYVGLSIGEQ